LIFSARSDRIAAANSVRQRISVVVAPSAIAASLIASRSFFVNAAIGYLLFFCFRAVKAFNTFYRA
jgi:hypothetical protein